MPKTSTSEMVLSKRSLVYRNYFLKLDPNDYTIVWENSKEIAYRIKLTALQNVKSEIEQTLLFTKKWLRSAVKRIVLTGDKNRIQKAITVLNRLEKI